MQRYLAAFDAWVQPELGLPEMNLVDPGPSDGIDVGPDGDEPGDDPDGPMMVTQEVVKVPVVMMAQAETTLVMMMEMMVAQAEAEMLVVAQVTAVVVVPVSLLQQLFVGAGNQSLAQCLQHYARFVILTC